MCGGTGVDEHVGEGGEGGDEHRGRTEERHDELVERANRVLMSGPRSDTMARDSMRLSAWQTTTTTHYTFMGLLTKKCVFSASSSRLRCSSVRYTSSTGSPGAAAALPSPPAPMRPMTASF
jgi:hypothetical protein